MAAVLVVGALGMPARAQEADDRAQDDITAAIEARDETLEQAPDSPPSPDDPFAAVVEADERVTTAALDRLEATTKSDEANRVALVAVGELQAAQADEKAAIAVREAAIDELAVERERLSDLTVQAYVKGGADAIDQYRAFVEGDTTDPAAGREIMFRQVLDRQEEVTEDAKVALKKARAELRKVRKVLAEKEAVAKDRLASAAELTQRRAVAEHEHVMALTAQADASAELRAAGSRPIVLVPLEVPIIGRPRLSAEDLTGWFEAGPYSPRVATPIADYARWFIDEGNAEGIRGDIAFVQAVLETGGFTNTDSVEGNNFSGIGHYDNLARGWSFASPQLGVRAQIQLLKSYAISDPNYANELVDRRLRGPAGCCQTWGDLTTVWATDPTYGTKVMLMYSSLVDYALDRRALGEG